MTQTYYIAFRIVIEYMCMDSKCTDPTAKLVKSLIGEPEGNWLAYFTLKQLIEDGKREGN